MSFNERNEAFRNAESAILQEITQPIATVDLVRKLMPHIDDEYSIRAAIWFLIGRGRLEILRKDNRVLLAKV